ncbi:uncharacterized protein ACNLHF_011913 [Anomaloglossus baeobatrachus]
MVWRESSNHLEDCYFCLVNVKGFNKKNKQYLQYQSITSAIRPIAYCEDIPVPRYTALPENVDTDLSSYCYTDEEDSPDIFQPCDEDCDKPILFTQSALNDLVRDLYLPKESAELLASRLQENRMLKPGTSVSFYRNREAELQNLGDVSEEQGKRFHQYIKTMEERYQGRWDSHMMADYCWSLMRDNPEAVHHRSAKKRKFK